MEAKTQVLARSWPSTKSPRKPVGARTIVRRFDSLRIQWPYIIS